MGEAMIMRAMDGKNVTGVAANFHTEILNKDTDWIVPMNLIGNVRVLLFGAGGNGPYGAAGGNMNNKSISGLKGGSTIHVTVGQSIANNNGGTTSFGTYLSATGGEYSRLSMDKNNRKAASGGTGAGGLGPGVGSRYGDPFKETMSGYIDGVYHTGLWKPCDGGDGTYGGGGGGAASSESFNGGNSTYTTFNGGNGGNGGIYGGGGGAGGLNNKSGQIGIGGKYGGNGGSGGNAKYNTMIANPPITRGSLPAENGTNTAAFNANTNLDFYGNGRAGNVSPMTGNIFNRWAGAGGGGGGYGGAGGNAYGGYNDNGSDSDSGSSWIWNRAYSAGAGGGGGYGGRGASGGNNGNGGGGGGYGGSGSGINGGGYGTSGYGAGGIGGVVILQYWLQADYNI